MCRRIVEFRAGIARISWHCSSGGSFDEAVGRERGCALVSEDAARKRSGRGAVVVLGLPCWR
eukprot:1236666-Alexandrium_andersonii.AAC.1